MDPLGGSDGAATGGVSYGDSGSSSTAASGTADGFSVDAQGGTDVVVDVAGAVADPGVYRLPAGSRVNDAVQRAGGETGRASVEAINLAARLTDGQQVVVPEKVSGATAVAASSGATGEPAGPIGLGAATVEQLDTIEGIAPSRRRRSSNSVTSTAASPPSTSSTRSTGSGRRRWRRCGRACSHDVWLRQVGWRFALLGGVAAGLAASPIASQDARATAVTILGLAIVGGALLAATPWPAGRAAWVKVAPVALAAVAAGLSLGAMRLAAIDRGAFAGPIGRPGTARGFVTAVPHRSEGEVTVRIQTAAGRLAVEAHEPVEDLPVGREVVARGTLTAPAPWEADYLARYGIRQVLRARSIELTGGRRGGLSGIVDGIRSRRGGARARHAGRRRQRFCAGSCWARTIESTPRPSTTSSDPG